MQLKQKIGELETEIEDLSKDNQRINLLYLEKKKEADVLKNSHGAMEFGNHEELVHLRKENDQLRRLLSVTFFEFDVELISVIGRRGEYD